MKSVEDVFDTGESIPDSDGMQWSSADTVTPESPEGEMDYGRMSSTSISDGPVQERSVESRIKVAQDILIVEDDVHLSKFLSRELKLRGFSTDAMLDGESACDHFQQRNCDLVILDLNLPKVDGMAVIKRVRVSKPLLPILVLTARNRTEDLVAALELGADDYLIKPFSFLELMARIRTLLRRNSAVPVSSTSVGNLILNREGHWVQRGNRRIDLTVREFALLEYLMSNVGKAVSRSTLMREVWNMPYDSTTNIVDVYMKYLRDKIDLDGEAKLIRTVRGVGYELVSS
jgi:DNA-binding response OmpR family regulator